MSWIIFSYFEKTRPTVDSGYVIELYIFILLIVLSLNFCQLPSPSTNEKSDEFKGKFPLSFHFSKWNLMLFLKIRSGIILQAGHFGVILSGSGIAISGVASPKKVGGPSHFSLLVSSKSYNIHTYRIPPAPIYKKLFNGFVLISGGVWT